MACIDHNSTADLKTINLRWLKDACDLIVKNGASQLSGDELAMALCRVLLSDKAGDEHGLLMLKSEKMSSNSQPKMPSYGTQLLLCPPPLSALSISSVSICKLCPPPSVTCLLPVATSFAAISSFVRHWFPPCLTFLHSLSLVTSPSSQSSLSHFIGNSLSSTNFLQLEVVQC
ncbi:hypothetical protein BHE74_00036487 [Ensete ventricosum]|uniref:Uncharacterized protein n=1 Tax=Ensete ventricosum TaxID=4639 RepID=A0A426Z0U7_ENSVE|nr:hypothetical protein B296_00047159 [Ensete ventricosum]RWW56767.1 hypothetical protein BHE74_00036487 [Ensete ventricosum]RZR95796.1 hypothetical protein BHM03_00024693 [Ensete ventricosum]